MLEEIVLPITEPETEWVDGRPVQKVSPTRSHSRLQGAIVAALIAWEPGFGEAGPEWRFRIAPPGEARRPLVPDVAFVSRERLRGFTADELEAPPFAPDVAFEVLSPDDRGPEVQAKIDVYLRSGTALVVIVDQRAHTLILHEREGRPRTLAAGDVFEHPALPGFSFEVGPFFARALDLPES